MDERHNQTETSGFGDKIILRWQPLVGQFALDRARTDNTFLSYARDLRLLKTYLDEVGVEKWTEITRNLVDNFLTREQIQGYSQRSIDHHTAVIRGFIDWLIRQNCPIPEETLESLRLRANFQINKGYSIERPPLSEYKLAKLFESFDWWRIQRRRTYIIKECCVV